MHRPGDPPRGPGRPSVVGVFNRVVDRWPDATAVEEGVRRLTYRELDDRANRLAHRLRGLGVREETPVAVVADRSIEAVVGFMGIVKAGGAAVPLDPGSPSDRLAFMLDDAGVRALVEAGHAIDAGELPRVAVEDVVGRSPAEPVTRPPDVTTPETLLYVVYTSGSTGSPKGVAVEHRGIIRLTRPDTTLMPRPGEGVLAAGRLDSDLWAWELWSALLSGARLVLHPPGPPDPDLVADTIVRHAVTVAGPSTGLFHQLVDGALHRLGGLRLVTTGGDVLSPDHAHRFLEAHPGCRLVNGYGPTEATVTASYHDVEPVTDGEAVPIGRAEPGVALYVLDEAGRPVEHGRTGELYIGGDGVARGYLNRPQLTRERFVRDPFADEPGARMYRTGDLVRRRADGALEFLGRCDDQVKIRGFRVEPAEVEAVAVSHPRVRQAAVVARDTPGAGRTLAAFVVGADALDRDGLAGELGRFLSARLPDHMRPTSIAVLDALPLTAAGKVDRARLPALVPDPVAGRAAADARPPGLLDVWRSVLGMPSLDEHDDFFELGGDSLLAVRLVGAIRHALGFDVRVADLFETRTVAALEERLAGSPTATRLPPLIAGERVREAPVSRSQAQVCFQSELVPGSLAYQFGAVVHLDGRLDVSALERALGAVVAGNEIYRTTFPCRGGSWSQRIHDPFHVRLPVIDVVPEPDPEAAFEALTAAELGRPVDMARLPLVRWTLVRLADDRHALVHVEHHLLHDGWSFMLFLEQLAGHYAAETGSTHRGPPSPQLQYADFARWQQAFPGTAEGRRQLEHWTHRLASPPAALDLPTDHPRPARPSHRGGQVTRPVPADLAERLAALSRSHGVTLFTTLLSAFAALLHRLSGAEELVVGSGLANRRLAETQDLIGMLVNTVALRIDAGGDPTAAKLLERVAAEVLEAQEHQEIPFEAVVEALSPERRADRNPLYDTLFSFHDTQLPGLELPELRFVPDETRANGSAKADINVVVISRREEADRRAIPRLEILWEYASDLFTHETATRMVDQYLLLLESLAADPAVRLSELELLGEEEAAQVRAWGTGSSAPYERDGTIPAVFEDRVREAPDAVALIGDEGEVTYAELDRAAGRLARRLIALGIRRGDRVGVCLERSAGMATGVLAILKAGAAYVPMEPAFPVPRLARLCRDAGVRVALTEARFAERLPPEVHGLQLDAIDLAEEPLPAAGAPPAGGPEDLAYIMFTSGSTGEPKGVEVTHRGVLRLVRGADYARLDAEQTLLALAPLSFDASTFELWGALLNGGRLAIAPAGALSPFEIASAIERHGVTTLWLTAGLFTHFVEQEPAAIGRLRQLLAGGDVLSPEHVAKALDLLADGAVLVNGYGPTEGTTFTCCHRMRRGEEVPAPVPIGRPIANTTVHILDPHGCPVPVGVPGELYIGGDGLARGYLGRPNLTAERFVEHPRAGRLYRTGDRARWRPGGVVEFLGRGDRQVKVRGFRIEPAEVEAELLRHPAVREAAVVARGERSDERRLVAYVASEGLGPEPGEQLRAFLSARVPAHLVPSAWVAVERLPLTANGKVDRAALPEPGRLPGAEVRPAPTHTDATVRTVAALFEDVLGVPVGPGDDFFELGGHSLLAVELFARIERRLGIRLPLAVIFEAPTVEGIADAVSDGAAHEHWASLVQVSARGTRPPFFAVTAGDGNAVGFGALARRLPRHQPFYALQPRGLDGRAMLHRSVEGMARAYVAEVRKVHPDGPYLLGGRCLGGLVAYEMACRLRAGGHEVALLAVFDSLGPRWQPRPLHGELRFDEVMNLCLLRASRDGELAPWVDTPERAKRFLAWLREPAPGTAQPLNRYLYEAYLARPDVQAAYPAVGGSDAARLVDWAWISGRHEMGLQEALLPAPTPAGMTMEPRRPSRVADVAARAGARTVDLVDVALRGRSRRLTQRREQRLDEIARAAAERYRAGPLDGRITLFRTTEFLSDVEIARWHGVESNGVDEHPVLGSHRSMLREPDVASLAGSLEARIAEALGEAAERMPRRRALRAA